MAVDVRRVVTGHDGDGRSVVLYDGKADNIIDQRFFGRVMLWTSDTLPVINDGDADLGAIQGIGAGIEGGTVFGIVRLSPGAGGRNHRTSTIDYGYVISGRIRLTLDKGMVDLNPGDTFVQRGTMHNWEVLGNEPCVFIVSMVGANPATAGGKALLPDG